MQIYLVGGAVRDQLLDYPVYDRDWVVVGATPQQMLAQGFKPVGSEFPVFIHPDSGEEYALARTERKSGKGYTGFQYHASPEVTLEEDLLRRDLTINAMAQAEDGQLIDPYQGRQDLENRLLRHVSPAFSEDPLRVLRVARFAARYAHLGFKVADETLALMCELAATDELHHLTAERVWKELERALAEPSPLVFFDLLQRCDALAVLLPELLPLYTLPREQLEQSVAKSCQLSKQADVRFAVLLSLATEALETEQASALIEPLCERLRSPKAFRELALLCRRWHPSLAGFKQLDDSERLALIQGLDLLRRPQRLPPLLLACQALHPDHPLPACQSLPALLERLSQLNPKQLMAEGFKGKALGQELQARQLQLCSALDD
ncbi:multifunctional CCA addition/repair protein [Marinobacterium arenosum]|uniref:multifunctional CCA addition/repair protein n=1 Tax=Marinobacterium arenosum TaxID=2862496 RepID=UPI001C968084|nr:multifunctional CCA addition/repair protein [Marinobacterium arenosum]MBY4676066.1 multifunctional CCA addition/repair protein [Marinobacterium arenosum]